MSVHEYLILKQCSRPKSEFSVSRWDLEGSAVNPGLVSIFNNDLTWNKIMFKVFSPVPCWKRLFASQISSQPLWESQKQLEKNLNRKGPQETFSLTFCIKDQTRFPKKVFKTWLAKNKYGDSTICSYNLPKAICSSVLTLKKFILIFRFNCFYFHSHPYSVILLPLWRVWLFSSW